MRIFSVIIILFISSSICSQKPFNTYKGSLAIGLSSGFGFYDGNNFIAKSYRSNNPVTFDLQFHLYKNYGFGCLYQHSESSLKSNEYVGNSSFGKFGRMGAYGCYYGKGGNKFLIVPKLGAGYLRLRNILDNSISLNNGSYDYKTWGSYYSISSDVDYFVTKELSVFVNVEYSYLDFNGVHASTANGVSYNSSNFYGVQLGVKFWAR